MLSGGVNLLELFVQQLLTGTTCGVTVLHGLRLVFSWFSAAEKLGFCNEG